MATIEELKFSDDKGKILYKIDGISLDKINIWSYKTYNIGSADFNKTFSPNVLLASHEEGEIVVDNTVPLYICEIVSIDETKTYGVVGDLTKYHIHIIDIFLREDFQCGNRKLSLLDSCGTNIIYLNMLLSNIYTSLKLYLFEEACSILGKVVELVDSSKEGATNSKGRIFILDDTIKPCL